MFRRPTSCFDGEAAEKTAPRLTEAWQQCVPVSSVDEACWQALAEQLNIEVGGHVAVLETAVN